MKLIFGYDVVTSNGVIPNCLNPKFLPTIYDGSKFNYGKARDYFIEKWSIDFAVFNGHEFNSVSTNKSVYEIINDRKNNISYEWYYIIEPHSGFDLFFGKNPVHNTFLMNFISEQSINEIVNHNGKLLINYVIDGGLGINTNNFNMIIDFTRKNNIPDEKVYMVFSDFKLKDNLIKLNVNYNVIDYNFYLRYKSHEFNKIINDKTNTSTIVTKEDFINKIYSDKKDFLLLTRHWKKHRIFLLNKLHRLGLDNNLVSWEKSYYNHTYIEDLKKHDNNEEFIDLVINTSKHIDVEDLVNIMGIGFENKEMYLNTYISLVTESMFFQDDINFPTGFLSEKIWKPIGHCQPFILAGPSKSLRYIREKYKFKTFHPFIDESYDDEDDDIKRIQMIELEVEKFSKKTKTEKVQFLNNVKDVCIYNQELFLKFGVDNFGKMSTNFDLDDVHTFLLSERREHLL
jgi:hypothetical protein